MIEESLFSKADIIIIILCTGLAAMMATVLALRATIKRQDVIITEALGHIREFILASLAFKASAETGAMVGPAVLQQLGKTKNQPLQPTAKEVAKTGVTVRQGSQV